MKNNYIFLFILFLIHGCGHKTHDIYFEVKNTSGWKDKYFTTNWYKEFSIDNNTTITISGINISAVSQKNTKLNFERKNLDINVQYQSYTKHNCKKNDTYIKIENQLKYPIKTDTYYGDTTPPILGCYYSYAVNPNNIEKFVLYFNNKNYHTPPVVLSNQKEERYHGTPP